MGCSSSAVTQQPQNEEHIGGHRQQCDQTLAPILDLKQRQLIKETWLQLQPERAHIGRQSFLRLFEEEPSEKDAFDLADYWGDDLLDNAAFQRQADRFGDTVGYLVDNIEKLCTDGAEYSIGAGVYHATRSGVSLHFFDSLVKPMLIVWQNELREDFTPAVKDAWQTLLLYMVQKMKEGFASATKGDDADDTNVN